MNKHLLTLVVSAGFALPQLAQTPTITSGPVVWTTVPAVTANWNTRAVGTSAYRQYTIPVNVKGVVSNNTLDRSVVVLPDSGTGFVWLNAQSFPLVPIGDGIFRNTFSWDEPYVPAGTHVFSAMVAFNGDMALASEVRPHIGQCYKIEIRPSGLSLGMVEVSVSTHVSNGGFVQGWQINSNPAVTLTPSYDFTRMDGVYFSAFTANVPEGTTTFSIGNDSASVVRTAAGRIVIRPR